MCLDAHQHAKGGHERHDGSSAITDERQGNTYYRQDPDSTKNDSLGFSAPLLDVYANLATQAHHDYLRFARSFRFFRWRLTAA